MPIPNVGAVPDVVTNTLIATDWGNAIGAASRGRVVQRFNSIAERDSSITAPVAGMICYVQATDLFYGYRTTGWGALPVPNVFYGRAYRNGAFTPVQATPVTMDTANFDPSSAFTPNPGKFTCPVAGFYSVSGALSASSSAANQLLVGALYHNGAMATNGALAISGGPGNIITSGLSDLFQSAAGDTISLACGFNGANLPGTVASPYTFLAVQYLHP